MVSRFDLPIIAIEFILELNYFWCIKKLFYLFFFFYNILCSRGNSVYSDYLSDNYYLLHPSMAGAANCSKIRLTAQTMVWSQDAQLYKHSVLMVE
jgi:hypothetical protein